MGSGATLPWNEKQPGNLAADLVAMFTKWPWSQYDGVPDPNPSQVTILDAVLSVVLESNFVYSFDQNDWTTFQPVVGSCNELLREIDRDVRLWDQGDRSSAGIERLSEVIMSLKDCYMWGASKLTKVLHRKRPSFIPILDSVLAGAFGHEAKHEKGDGLSNSCFALVMFRDALVEALPCIEETLSILRDQAPGLCPTITPVRAAEALIYWNRRTKRGISGGWDGADWK